MIELTEEDIRDFTAGAAVLGTGGGGDPERGAEILLEDRRAGHHVRLSPIEEVQRTDGVLVVPYLVGTIAQKRSQQEGLSELIKNAIRAFEKEFGERVIGTVATEVGGLNSAMSLHAAAQGGILAIDADVVGRAAPEASHTVLNLAGIPLLPAVVATGPGQIHVLKDAMTGDAYEARLRALSMGAKGYVAVVDSPCRPAVVKDILVSGTMSASIAIGRARREAAEHRKDPIDAVRRAVGGRVVFRGSLSDVATRDEGGFLKGDVTIAGSGAYARQTFRSRVINEHIMGWRQDRPLVMPPDCFTFLDREGKGLMNNVLEVGMPVSVMAWKAPAQWRTEKGLELFGPRHFGLGFDYVPMETLVGF